MLWTDVLSMLLSGFCHFGLVLFMILWQSPDTPIMSAFSCERAASSVLESHALSRLRALFHVGAWCLDPGTHVLSFGHVTGFGHSRSIFCHCVSARSRVRSAPRTLVHVCFVVLHAVRVSIGCVHLCYILCCVARSLYIHWLRAIMLSCLVWTHGLWVFSLAGCSCLVLHMAGDLFAGHVLVFLFCVSTWLLS